MSERATPQIWIIEQVQPYTLFDDPGIGRFILVDAEYTPLLDAQGKPYRAVSLARAEVLLCKVLQPFLLRLTAAL